MRSIVPDALHLDRPLPAIAAGLLLVLVAAGCAQAKKPHAARVPVLVASAETRAMPVAIQATGTVEAIRTASVGSQVGGVVTHIPFHEGDEVQQGRLLFQLDPRPFANTLAQARATWAKDKAQARLAAVTAERNHALFQKGVIAQQDWDSARANAEAAKATADADSANVMAARLSLEYASIRGRSPTRSRRRAPRGPRTRRRLGSPRSRPSATTRCSRRA